MVPPTQKPSALICQRRQRKRRARPVGEWRGEGAARHKRPVVRRRRAAVDPERVGGTARRRLRKHDGHDRIRRAAQVQHRRDEPGFRTDGAAAEAGVEGAAVGRGGRAVEASLRERPGRRPGDERVVPEGGTLAPGLEAGGPRKTRLRQRLGGEGKRRVEHRAALKLFEHAPVVRGSGLEGRAVRVIGEDGRSVIEHPRRGVRRRHVVDVFREIDRVKERGGRVLPRQRGRGVAESGRRAVGRLRLRGDPAADRTAVEDDVGHVAHDAGISSRREGAVAAVEPCPAALPRVGEARIARGVAAVPVLPVDHKVRLAGIFERYVEGNGVPAAAIPSHGSVKHASRTRDGWVLVGIRVERCARRLKQVDALVGHRVFIGLVRHVVGQSRDDAGVADLLLQAQGVGPAEVVPAVGRDVGGVVRARTDLDSVG